MAARRNEVVIRKAYEEFRDVGASMISSEGLGCTFTPQCELIIRGVQMLIREDKRRSRAEAFDHSEVYISVMDVCGPVTPMLIRRLTATAYPYVHELREDGFQRSLANRGCFSAI